MPPDVLMCAIAGFHGAYDLAVLQEMTRVMAHRGPDDDGHELLPGAGSAAPVGLGHRRLSIIDLSSGHQPLWDANRRAAIVFNGEIYNYRELRHQLSAVGRPFRTNSDTEVIVQGWLEWGEGILQRLEGMFAFALWDAERRSFLLARDRFGIKPLYYCMPKEGGFAFASEAKALLPFVGGAQPNRAALLDYLLHGWCGTEETIFSGVRQLLPGRAMLWDPACSGARVWRYWTLQPAEVRPADWSTAIREAFDEAVRSHMIADVPVGLALSGGLDSSTVLASMVRYTEPQRLRAFCVGYGLPDDELPYARAAARAYAIELGERVVAPQTFAENFAPTIWHLEEPIAHPVMQTTYQLSRFVREHGKVVLIGEGADELFGGYPEFRLFTRPFVLTPPGLRRRAFLDVCCLMPRAATLQRLLSPAVRDRQLLDSLERRFDPYFAERPQAGGALRFELETALPFNQLSRVDKLMMAHSVEARVPFLDHRFAEIAMAIPFCLKVSGSTHKRALREAMADRLPQDVVHRPKSGKRGTQALLPTLLAMVTRGALAHLISREALGARGWFDPDAVSAYLRDADTLFVRFHPIERRRRAKFALALAVLEQWARLFLDREAVNVAV